MRSNQVEFVEALEAELRGVLRERGIGAYELSELIGTFSKQWYERFLARSPWMPGEIFRLADVLGVRIRATIETDDDESRSI